MKTAKPDISTQFVKKQVIEEAIGLSSLTFRRYRYTGEWIEGVHYFTIGSRIIRYNLPLIQDWLINRGSPMDHQRAIENFQSQLSSNQKKDKAK